MSWGLYKRPFGLISVHFKVVCQRSILIQDIYLGHGLLFCRVELCTLVIMATNMSTDKNVLMCKKCGLEHERPVGSKCERGKSIKDEKRDTSKETTVRKTPRGKGTDMSSQEKILETVHREIELYGGKAVGSYFTFGYTCYSS